MTTAADLITDEGVRLRSCSDGKHYTTCPQCSERRRAGNRKKPCLRVEIDGRGVRFT